jgi:glutamate/tyrosine decarboxylase-like PLP-dependent enzyme
MDPTETYHKQIQQAMQNCKDLAEESKQKYLLNIKPVAPKINAYIKTHKEDEPIRPVIDNTQAPTYKIAKFLNNKIKTYINLHNTHVSTNTRETAQEIHKLQITDKHKMITLDIKDLYVNMPKQGIIQSTIFWLDKNNTSKEIKEQFIKLLKIIMDQNYF